MPTKNEVYLALFAWLQSESGLTVIKANQKGPRPARPYVSLNFINPSSEMGGDDQYTTDPSTGVVTTAGPRSAQASVNIFGPDSVDMLAKVRDSLQRPDVIDAFDASGITILDTSNINDLTEQQETIYEERGQVDITLSFTVSSDVDMKTIDIASLTGTIETHTVVIDAP